MEKLRDEMFSGKKINITEVCSLNSRNEPLLWGYHIRIVALCLQLSCYNLYLGILIHCCPFI